MLRLTCCPAARALAREIADNTAPVSIAITRQLIWRMAGASHPMEAHMADSRGIQLRGAQGDAREGVSSFLEKRAPVFPDKVSKDLPDIWPQYGGADVPVPPPPPPPPPPPRAARRGPPGGHPLSQRAVNAVLV